MDDDLPLDAPPPADEGPADDAPGADTTPTAQAAYTLAQGLSDLAGSVGGMLAKGEHVKGRKAVKKLLDKLTGLADEAAGVAEMVEADTADDEPADDADADPDDTDTYADDGADEPADDDEREPADEPPAPVRKAADGRLLTKSGFRPLRFRVSDLRPVPVPVRKAAPPAADAAKRAEIARIRREAARIARAAAQTSR